MKKYLIYLIVLCFCCGCQDKKNLLNLLFPSSMAIDYRDKQYHIALQIDNLNTVAKAELESSSQNASLLVATGSGKSIEEAINQIEESQRSVISFSHVRSLILLPGALEDDVTKDICNFAVFNPELRMDTDVYYSEEEMEKLYSTNFQIGRSQLYTLTNSPEFKKVSMVLHSINLMQLAKAINDQNITVELPVLKVEESQDKYISDEGENKQKVYQIENLLYLNATQKTHQTLAYKDLLGIQWVTRHTNNIDVNVRIDDLDVNAYTTSVNAWLMYNPQTEKYYLKGKAQLVVTRDMGIRPLKDIQPAIEKAIHDQIQHTYQTGLKEGIDVYNLHYLSMIMMQDVQPNANNFVDDLKIELQIKGSYISSEN